MKRIQVAAPYQSCVSEVGRSRIGRVQRLAGKLHQYTYSEKCLQWINRSTDFWKYSSAILEEIKEAGAYNTPQYQTIFIGDSLNEVPEISELLRNAFSYIEINGFLICRLELSEQRRKRLFGLSPTGLTYLRYVIDYMLHRVAPRLGLTRKLYRVVFPTGRVLSRAEALGRMIHAGYSLTDTFESSGQFYIIAQKKTASFVQRPDPSEGVLLKMRRVGQYGQPFQIYKIRTMHPYSEYLQEYMHKINGLEVGGKFKDDFRINSPGRFMRKYWLDEIPMFINFLKRDIKLVGVRPISFQYFSLYPEDVQQERIKHKPGLLPPYYADLPQGFDEIIESERRYLQAYNHAPLKTDFTYFLKILYNILCRRVRSK